MRFLNFLLLISIMFSCKNARNTVSHEEIKTLTTVEKQRQFLEHIYDADQQVRKEDADIKKMVGIDRDNLQKIEAYLADHGHPTVKEHGEKAANAPWLVIHHSPEGVAPRKRNFKYLYNAYQRKDIDNGAFTFYLNRWYRIKNGAFIQWEGSFTTEEELDTLYKSLDLVDTVREMDR